MAKQPRPLMGMRPTPYNRNERMMGGMGGGMGMGSLGYGRGRGRNLKGNRTYSFYFFNCFFYS